MNLELTVQDRIRLFLNRKGEREISVTIDEIAQELSKDKYTTSQTVYQGLYRLEQLGEIELIREINDGIRPKIIGVKINKLEPSGRTYKRAAERERSRTYIANTKVSSEADPSMPYLIEYLKKKSAIEDMRYKALEAGLNPDEVIQFIPEPIAEEAIMLLQTLSETKETLREISEAKKMLEFDLEAERRNVADYKRRLGLETRKTLLAVAEG